MTSSAEKDAPRRPLMLDLFCCEGGASMGYHRGGWDVCGGDLFQHVDDKGRKVGHNQKRYPFPSWKGDALVLLRRLLDGDRFPFPGLDGGQWRTLADFAAIAASPPCWKYSITNHNDRDYPDLIGPVRELLRETGLPYVIENVVGAPLIDPIELCGCMFDLKAVDDDGIMLHLQRARLFESNVRLLPPHKPSCSADPTSPVVPSFASECSCSAFDHDHSDHEWVGGCYGGARRDKYEAKYVRKGGYVPPNKAVVEAYMGIDWMTWKGLHQSIPPAYTEHIGRQLIDHLLTRVTSPGGPDA